MTFHPVFHNGPPLLTGEIKHLSQIGKVLVLATPTPPPCQEGIIFHLSTTMWSARLNSLRSCHRSLEFMLCTCDFSVWNITPAPSLPPLLFTCNPPGKTHPELQASPPQRLPPLWCLSGFPRWHAPCFWNPPTLSCTYLVTHLQLSHPSYTALSFYTALTFGIINDLHQAAYLLYV